MAKFKFYASTGYNGSQREEVVEIPDEELEGLNEEEKSDYIQANYFDDWVVNNVELNFWEVRK
jgi:hypothetical protein